MWQFNRLQPEVLAIVLGPPSPTANAVTIAEAADTAYWDGDLAASVELYSQAAALEPTNMAIQLEYVRTLIYRSYSGQSFAYNKRIALTVAENAIALAPNDSRAQAAYALALLENDRPDEAALAALTATELAPNWAEPHAYLSFAYYELRRNDSAIDQARIAVNLNPDSVEGRRALAHALAYSGDYSDAIQELETAIEIHPRLDAPYFEVAGYYRYLEYFEAAIQAYDHVLSMNPRNVRAWTRKCEVYTQMREDALAQEACEQAIDLDPTFPEAYRQLGMIQYQRRNFEGAIETLTTCRQLMTNQAVPLEDQEIQCYYVQGLAYYELAECAQAMPLLNTALEIPTSDHIRSIILEGINRCVETDDAFTSDDLPPSPSPTPIPAESINIY
jgi:tetratricopeptide (TPR) repeat protein